MKFSIITWDACFRESFHTVDSFGRQEFSENEFEFFYCDFYTNNNSDLRNKIDNYSTTNLVNLNSPQTTQWHLGKTINEGIKKATGEILIIPDGDIIVPPTFLKQVEELYNNSCRNLVCYFRRWDEPMEKHCHESYDIDYLSQVCKLNNMTNYGGCFVIRKEVFEEIGYYEEHDVFSGPGANGMEQYKRFRNKGLPIMWSDIKVFHPHHSFTGSSDKIDQMLIQASKSTPWIVPYMGLKQSWVLKQLDKHIHWKANSDQIDKYLEELQPIQAYIINHKRTNIISKAAKLLKLR